MNILIKNPKKYKIIYLKRSGSINIDSIVKKKDLFNLEKIESFKYVYLFPFIKAVLFSVFFSSNKMQLKVRIKYKYYEILFKIIKPKIIITTTDNDPFFYFLKNQYKEAKYILIQNGKKNHNYLIDLINFFSKTNHLKSAKLDYFFSYGNLLSYYLKNTILPNTKFINHGSIINNQIPKNYKKKKEICLISDYVNDWPDKDKIEIFNNKRIKKEVFYKVVKLIFPKLVEFCEKNKIKLIIITRSNYNDDLEKKNKENLFFYSLISKKKKIFFTNDQKISKYEKYKITDSAILNLGFGTSSLDLEVLSRGNKFCFLNHRGKFLDNKGYGTQGYWDWPLKIRKNDFYVINSINKKEIFQNLSSLVKVNKSKYLIKKNKFENNFIYFDYKNSQLRKIINKNL